MLDAVLTAGEKRSRKWYFIVSLVLNAALMAAIYIKFQVVFEGPDDIAIAQFVNGSSGSYDPHLVYSNYILGVIWCFLYRVLPGIAWYSWFQFVLLCLSFTAITYVLMCRIGRVGGLCMSLVMLCFASYEFYVNLQYTKTAAVLTVAGVLLILHAIAEAKISWRALILGFVLAAFAVMYRYKEFYACLLLMAVGIGFWLLFHLRREVRKGRRALRLLRWLAVFIALAAMSVGLLYYDRQQYTSPQWQAYTEYNNTRSDLFDYGLPDYQENKALYDELDIDENAYNLYCTWNAGDTDKLNVETMRRLIDAREKQSFGPDTVLGMLREVPAEMPDNRIFLGVIAAAVLWILWGRHDMGTHFALILECAAFFGLYLYMYYHGRYLFNRVDTGLWLAFEAVLLWSFRPDPVGRAGVLVGEAGDSSDYIRVSGGKPEGIAEPDGVVSEASSDGIIPDDHARTDVSAQTDTSIQTDAAARTDAPVQADTPAQADDFVQADASVQADTSAQADAAVKTVDSAQADAYSQTDTDLAADHTEADAGTADESDNTYNSLHSSVDIEDFDYGEAIDAQEPIERKRERSRGFRWFMMIVRVVCIAAVLVFSAQYEYTGWKTHTRGARSNLTARLERNADTLLETSADTEHMYVTKLGQLSASESFGPFDVMPRNCLSNVVVLGGWRLGTAQYNDILDRYGADENPYKALISDGDVYLADNDIETTLTYLRDYYDETAQAEEVDEINGIRIYRIVTGQPAESTDTASVEEDAASSEEDIASVEEDAASSEEDTASVEEDSAPDEGDAASSEETSEAEETEASEPDNASGDGSAD